MSKFLRIVLIIGVIGALIYAFFLFFVSPAYNHDKLTLVQSYFDNITSESLCEDHYNADTLSHCLVVQNGLKTATFTHEEVLSGEAVIVTITIGTTSDTFTVTFVEEDNTALSRLFHKTIYYIDLIQ